MNRCCVVSTLVALIVLSGCTSIEPRSKGLFEPLGRNARAAGETAEVVVSEQNTARVAIEHVPSPVYEDAAAVDGEVSAGLSGGKISANFRDMPLPEFLNEALAEQLGLSYVSDPGIAEIEDLVTLNLSEPLSPEDFYRMTKTVLAEYGVAVIENEGFLKIRADRNASATGTPLLVSGKTLPEVPGSHRPIFMLVPLHVLRTQQAVSALKQLYADHALTVHPDAERNSLILQGSSVIVKEAAKALELLDQPLMKGRYNRSYRPGFMPAEDLAKGLIKVLTSEGYSATSNPPFGSVFILPFPEQQRVLIFAPDQSVLDHTLEWAQELDRDLQNSVADGFFTYQAMNVTAEHIAQLLGALHGDENQMSPRNNNQLDAENDQKVMPVSSYMGGSLVVDGNRNVLFFSGSGQEWSRLLALIERIDKPVPMVLIDVLLAEITLTEGEESGVEWLFRSRGVEGTNLTGSTLGGLALGGNGLSLTFDSAGETRALVNAFYNNDRASIRSSPKLLVKSGETAFIEVGNEIPLLTSNSQSTDSPGSPVIQSIQYRKTGVLLTISPIVQASGLVDLVISQELSEQQSTSGSIGSPTILNRRIDTSLALRDGGSVLLGGLISDNRADGSQGVPPFGRIPMIGKLFRVDSVSVDRTELIMLVSTYVVTDHDEATEITEILKSRLSIGEF